MPKKYEVVAITGTYQKEGQTKNRYANLGVVIEQQGSLMLKLETIPVGWDGWAYLNEPRQAEEQPARRAPASRPSAPPRRGSDFNEDNPPF